MTPEALIDRAREAAARAYAPYSRFPVGAALLLTDGGVVAGANVENASYGLSLCAEAVVIARAANEGRLGDIIAIAVAGGAGNRVVTPCGRCRQLLNESAELGGRDIIVHCAAATGATERHMLSALLPCAFGPKDIA